MEVGDEQQRRHQLMGTPRRRTRSENAAAINRAKRAEEVDLKDNVLRVTDTGLSEVETALVQAALAVDCRPHDAAERIRTAREAVQSCRRLLLIYYDGDHCKREDLNG
jgi:hypothetical protein